MARPKKSKRKVHAPKLCPADHVIYAILLTLCIVLAFLPILLVLLWQKRMFLSSGEVLAYNESGWLLLTLIPAIPLFIPLGFVANAWGSRKPIVGPKPPPPSGPVVKKKKAQKPRDRRITVLLIVALVGIYLLTLIPAVGSAFARTEITAAEIREYTLFGIQTKSTPLSEVAAVEARIYYGANRSSFDWKSSYTVTMQNGKAYTFAAHPLTLVEIDRHMPPCPHVSEGVEYLGKLCREYDLNAEEAARVRALFRTYS